MARRTAAMLAAALALMVMAAFPPAQSQRQQQLPRAVQPGTPCGGPGQKCCAACASNVPEADCDKYNCRDGRICYKFSTREMAVPDGTRRTPMLCLDAPQVRYGAACACGWSAAAVAPTSWSILAQHAHTLTA